MQINIIAKLNVNANELQPNALWQYSFNAKLNVNVRSEKLASRIQCHSGQNPLPTGETLRPLGLAVVTGKDSTAQSDRVWLTDYKFYQQDVENRPQQTVCDLCGRQDVTVHQH